MTDKELRHLSRMELIQLLLDQARELESTRQALAQAQAELQDRTLRVAQAGTLAEAALSVSGVLQAAQQAADTYRLNVQARCDQLLRDTQKKCAAMLDIAQQKAGGDGTA